VVKRVVRFFAETATSPLEKKTSEGGVSTHRLTEGEEEGTGGRLSLNIITPYSSQCALIRRMVPDHTDVNTVDSYQGREADIVIISTVRSKRLGFTDDARRINVSLTRARQGMVVIGHAPTLQKGRWWSQWLIWVSQNGLVISDTML